MTQEQLKEYIEILRKFNDQKLTGSIEERKQIGVYNNLYATNPEAKTIIDSLKNEKNIYKQEEIIKNYLEEKKVDDALKKNNDAELIATTVGIDVSKIDHQLLETGKEIFKFYDPNMNKYIVLENGKDGKSLQEQLKEMQEENKKFTQYDDEQNTYSMLEHQRLNENNELQMISFNQLDNYQDIINKLDEKQLEALRLLISQKEILNLQSINIENGFAMDNNGKIYESFFDKDLNKYVLKEKSDNKEKNMETEELENTVQLNTLEVKKQIDENKAKMYQEYPELLEQLPSEERKQYEEYNNSIQNNNVIEFNKEKQKVKIFKLDRAGFANAVLLSLITGFFGGMLTTMAIMIFKIKSL